jgi:hypothetical protein
MLASARWHRRHFQTRVSSPQLSLAFTVGPQIVGVGSSLARYEPEGGQVRPLSRGLRRTDGRADATACGRRCRLRGRTVANGDGRHQHRHAGLQRLTTSEGPNPSDRRVATSRVQESPKFLDEDYATRVVELLQVIGEIGEADLVPRISERYLPAQAIVAEGTLSEERTAF